MSLKTAVCGHSSLPRPARRRAIRPETFAGTISDEMCALNHAAMRMGPTDAECTHACVEEHDAAYVLADGKTPCTA